jgi:hypothetical protein
MAEGRMLKKRISTSEKFAKLKNPKAQLLYLMMLPHLDVEGRIEANSLVIKGLCVPLLRYSANKIEEYCELMSSIGLIEKFSVDGHTYYQFTRFKDFQQLRENKEAPSHFPSPVKVREQVGSDTGKDNRSKENIIHGDKTPTREMIGIFTRIFKEFRDGTPRVAPGKDGSICKALYKQCCTDRPADPLGLWAERVRALMEKYDITGIGGISAFWNSVIPKKQHKGKTWADD